MGYWTAHGDNMTIKCLSVTRVTAMNSIQDISSVDVQNAIRIVALGVLTAVLSQTETPHDLVDGVAFNTNGHPSLARKVMSVGLR